MRPIMTSPCSVCGVTLTHDQDPGTVLCGGCERDRRITQAHAVPPPTSERHEKPPQPDPPPMRTPEKLMGIDWSAFAVALTFSFGFASAFLCGWIARGGS